MDEGLNNLQSFNPVESNGKLLEQTLVGRKDLVDVLEELVIESATSGNKFQRLIIGPRGSGKTHLLRVLYNRVSTNVKLKDKLTVAYLCEDEYGIASFLDLIIRILRSLLRWDPTPTHGLADKIELLKKIPPYDQEKMAVKILLDRIGQTTLLIIIENIGDIFTRIALQGQRKLRDLVQQYACFSIMASNCALFKDIQFEDKPFHNFFKINHLKKLTIDEAVWLLKSIALWEENHDLFTFLNLPEVTGKINAIYDLTGGNHRLLVTFYYFFKADYKNTLSLIFLKTINSLIPYYQNSMKELSALQQKMVQYLYQNRTPSNVKEIAENCFSSQNTISKQLSILVKLRFVDAASVGKETFYELSEPLLRICFEVTENRSGPIKLFVDFLGNLYSAEQITEVYLRAQKLASMDVEKQKVWEIEQTYYKEVLKKFHPHLYRLFDKFQLPELHTGTYNYTTNKVKGGQMLIKTPPAYYGTDHLTNLATKLDEFLVKSMIEQLETLLLKGQDQLIVEYFREALKLSTKHDYAPYFLKAIPKVILDLLARHEEIELQRFEFIETQFTQFLKGNPGMSVPLKFLNTGIRHLKKKEKNVLFQFTKEERATFKTFVIEKVHREL